MISNCGHDENGKYSGGTAGDQTGAEWQVIQWYNRPWDCVLRHPNALVREKIASLAEAAAKNDKIGYDQAERDTYEAQLKKANYDPSKITTACEADCSSGICAHIRAVGQLLGIAKLKSYSGTYTGNMRAAARSAGFTILTDSKYLTSADYLMAGDILLNDASHVATNLTTGCKATTSTTAAASTTILSAASFSADPKTIWDYLMGKIGNAYGVAGLMGNLYAESGLIPGNLQDSYESKLGYTDYSYTSAVDNGSYTKFDNDSAGYGLAQWTYSSRKKALKTYADSKKASIGNLSMQLEFLYKELSESFPAVLASLKKATSVLAASNLVLTKFEAPSDQSASVKKTRASYGQTYYNTYANGQSAGTSSTSVTAADQVVATEVAHSKDPSLSGSYIVTANSLNIRNGAGTDANTYGSDKHPLVAVPKDTSIQCYGYYTDVDSVKWLYVQATQDGVMYTGFCSSAYLTKKSS